MTSTSGLRTSSHGDHRASMSVSRPKTDAMATRNFLQDENLKRCATPRGPPAIMVRLTTDRASSSVQENALVPELETNIQNVTDQNGVIDTRYRQHRADPQDRGHRGERPVESRRPPAMLRTTRGRLPTGEIAQRDPPAPGRPEGRGRPWEKARAAELEVADSAPRAISAGRHCRVSSRRLNKGEGKSSSLRPAGRTQPTRRAPCCRAALYVAL